MRLRSLFQKQILIRLANDDAFICTSKWPLLSASRRIGLKDVLPEPVLPNYAQGGVIDQELPITRRTLPE